jgi:hypothetical protein
MLTVCCSIPFVTPIDVGVDTGIGNGSVGGPCCDVGGG